MIVTGLFSLLSGAGESGKLSTLAFHKVPRHADPLVPGELCLDHFEQILSFLTTHFRVLPLSEAVGLLSRGKLPRRAVSITFDDGYGDWHRGVSAVLKAHNTPATFFIVTEQLSGIPLWNERIIAAVRALPAHDARLPAGLDHLSDLSAVNTRIRLISALLERLTYCDLEMRLRAIEDLEAQAITPLAVAAPFTAEDVLELHCGGFEIGAHTVRHPTLTKCSEKNSREEIGNCREELEALVRAPITLFAYPNGRPSVDFSEDHVRMVRECGYHAAVTTTWGVATTSTDPFNLPRFTPWGRKPWRIGLQMARNMSTAARGPEWWGWRPAKAYSLPRPCRIMTVETGAGFGGAVVALETLLEGLSPSDVEVFVISNYAVGRFSTLQVVREQRIIHDRRINLSQLVQAVRSGDPETSAWRWVILFALGRLDDVINRFPYFVSLLREVYRIRPDIVHGNNTPLSNREAIIAARIAGVPYIQHVRGSLEPGGGERWLLRAPSMFIAVSKWLERSLLDRGVEPGRIQQIYDALPVQRDLAEHRLPHFRAELGIPGSAQVVAMLGMLLPWKGQQLFLTAIGKIAHEFPDTYFVLIGGTPRKTGLEYEKALRSQIESMDLGRRVFMTGMRSDVYQLLPEVDAVVSASIEPEPLGLVMLEGMMAGKLFIGPAHGAATEIIEHGKNGLLFEPGDAGSLAAVLEAYLSCPGNTHSLAVRGQEDVARMFRQEIQAERFVEQVRAVTKHSGRQLA